MDKIIYGKKWASNPNAGFFYVIKKDNFDNLPEDIKLETWRYFKDNELYITYDWTKEDGLLTTMDRIKKLLDLGYKLDENAKEEFVKDSLAYYERRESNIKRMCEREKQLESENKKFENLFFGYRSIKYEDGNWSKPMGVCMCPIMDKNVNKDWCKRHCKYFSIDLDYCSK